MSLMKIFTSFQELQKTRFKKIGHAAQVKLFSVAASTVILMLVIVEFGLIEPTLNQAKEKQGIAILDFFSKSIRNDLLAGYRGGLNVASELLVSAGQCHYVKIYDANQNLIASFPTPDLLPLDQNRAYDLKAHYGIGKEIDVQWSPTHIIFTKFIYFDEMMGSRVGMIQVGVERRQAHSAILESRSAILAAGLVVLCLFWLILQKISQQNLTKPLLVLSQKLEAMNRKGKLTDLNPKEIEFSELKEIYAHCKLLVDRIKTAEDIIERKGATTAIGELMQDFSHGIRTPITVIKNRALDIAVETEKLLNSNGFSEKVSENFKCKLTLQREAIIEESNRVETFVSRILDSTQPIDVCPTPTLLFNLVEKVIDFYRHQSFNKKIVFLNQVDPKLPILLLDRVYFEEVFDNLFSNSIYALENNDQIEEGYIRVSSNKIGPEMSVSVEDNGCGIEERNLKMIFKPHFTTKKGRGNGRGLFIVQRILDKHRAHMTVESKLSKGTNMTIHFGERNIHDI